MKMSTFDFLVENYPDKIDWKSVSMSSSLTQDFVIKYNDMMHFNELSKNPNLTSDLIIHAVQWLNWDFLSGNPSLTIDLIEQYIDLVNWTWLSRNPNLTLDFIRKHQDKLNWKFLSMNPNLTTEFIEEFIDKWDWYYLCQNTQLTLPPTSMTFMTFLEKYIHKWNWRLLSKNPNLPLEFIEKYIYNEFDWISISKCNKNLTPEFIEKHLGRWNSLDNRPNCAWDGLISNPSVPFKFAEKHAYRSTHGWLSVLTNPNITAGTIEKYLIRCRKCNEENKAWRILIENKNLPLEFLENTKYSFLKDRGVYNNLSSILPIEFIEKHLSTLVTNDYWYSISLNPNLTLDFVKKHLNDKNTHSLIANKCVTIEFIKEYIKGECINELYWTFISLNPNLTSEFIEEHKDKMKLSYLAQNPGMTFEIIEKYIISAEENGIVTYASTWSSLAQNPFD